MQDQLSMGDKFLTLIKQIIEDNIDNEDFSVEELSKNAGLSRSALHRRLIKLAGKSPREYITEIRLSRAIEFLRKDVATVSEIAYMVGFRSPSYFDKVFKRYYNLSPSDFRRKLSVDIDHSPIGKKRDIPVLGRSRRYRLLLRALAVFLAMMVIVGVSIFIFSGKRSSAKSLAVLPFQNLTGQQENVYFVEGLHDVLIGELGRIESLRVISRTSTLHYRNSEMLLRDIATEMGVDIIVEGSVMEAGDSLKLLIQVIDVFPEEDHLLVNEYKGDMHDVLNLQRSAAKDIAQIMHAGLSEEEERVLFKSITVNPLTYRDYLRGLYYLNQGKAESFEKGINYMFRATEQDPGDPFAYAGLALGYAIQGHGMIAPEGSFRTASVAAERALRIDPTLDEAHTALALIYSYQLWDWPKVKNAFEKALSNNPNNAIAHAHYAFYHVHFDAKEKALFHANMAITLEPFSASYHAWLAWLYFYYGDLDKAEIMAHRALELQPDIPYGNLVLGWVHIQRKEYQKAIELHKKLPVYGDYYKMLIGYTYIQSGEREKAIALWNEMENSAQEKFVNPFHRGMMAGMLGYVDRAFDLFNEACDHKYYPITYIDIFPGIDSLKDDPRYAQLLQKMNLPYNKSMSNASL